ncbi:NAD(P)-binding domain-containing protein [Amycolatopsis sp. NPDC005232]|uniref:NAD(P)-binding domain-containing protein n=1 Tax=Amycolatopsis sp. NPDC005232 TaxID=3157027 RepID=UPI0033B3E188
MTLSIGFIGLGDQGAPLATAIAETGFPLHVWARRPASLTAVAGVAHTAHNTVADLAAAVDVLALCVSEDEDVLGLLTGGLLDALRPGAVVVNHGTGVPSAATRMASLCAAHDVSFVRKALLDVAHLGRRLDPERRRRGGLPPRGRSSRRCVLAPVFRCRPTRPRRTRRG